MSRTVQHRNWGRPPEEARGAEETCVPVAEWMGFVPDEEQAEVIWSEGQNVILCCSRQWGKTSTAAALVAMEAMKNAGREVLVLSTSLPQTAILMGKVRGMLERAGALAGSRERELRLTNGTVVVAVSEKHKFTRGHSAPLLLVVDEAAQVKDGNYHGLVPMLATGGGRIVLLSTPFGQRGFFWKEWVDEGNGWLKVEVPATRCARISPVFLMDQLRRMGKVLFGQEFLCEFGGVEEAAVSVAAVDAMKRRSEDWEVMEWE